MKNKHVLVTGATGYIGGRLVPKLLAGGYKVRVLVRDPLRLQYRVWEDQVEIFQGDVLKNETLPEALQGISVAYYLIHNMSQSIDFHQRDLLAARNFSKAALKAKIDRIIYLGGLGDPKSDLSEHLKSRQETGRVLAESGIPVTEFRAAIIVGSGSISFEMIRYLTERIPVMICPRWVFTKVQPIAIQDVLSYLVGCIEIPDSSGRIIEIGGADVITYGDMMKGYAKVRGLRRFLIPIPLLTPRLSSYWVHWMTPVPASITRPLIEGLRNEVIVKDPSANDVFPDIDPLDYTTSVRDALSGLGNIESRWTDSLMSSMGDQVPVQLNIKEGMISERRQEVVLAPPIYLFRIFTSLGGNRGWLTANWAWEIRGMIDRLIGGVGLRRGRRSPDEVRPGDVIDFWRVEKVKTDSHLLLRAEMKLPGKAWLEFEAQPLGDNRSRFIQTAFFIPKGLFGLLYWYGLYPIHSFVYSGMARKIKHLAEESYKSRGK